MCIQTCFSQWVIYADGSCDFRPDRQEGKHPIRDVVTSYLIHKEKIWNQRGETQTNTDMTTPVNLHNSS